MGPSPGKQNTLTPAQQMLTLNTGTSSETGGQQESTAKWRKYITTMTDDKVREKITAICRRKATTRRRSPTERRLEPHRDQK
jgi:hypothetical protein